MKKVLLVEDDAFIRDLTSIKLTEHAYAVLVAHNGAEAIELLRSDRPDIVLLDLDLPDMHGLQVLEQMKGDDVLKNIPVVIFSNSDDVDAKKKAEQLGADDFFIKATTAFADLLLRIKELSGS